MSISAEETNRINAIVTSAAQSAGVDPTLMIQLKDHESGGNPNTKPSETGVQGLFQITGDTYRLATGGHIVNGHVVGGETPSLTVEDQSRVACIIMKGNLTTYHGDVPLALIAYNAGPAVANRMRDGATVEQAVMAVFDKPKYTANVKVYGENFPARKVVEVRNYVGQVLKTDTTGEPYRTPPKTTSLRAYLPSVDDATPYKPPVVPASASNPMVAPDYLSNGLDSTPWYKKPLGKTTLCNSIAEKERLENGCFEIMIDRGNNYLPGGNGQPIMIPLNVGLKSLSEKETHAIQREPTPTGMVVSFWGMQLDTIVGRGSTGAFINRFGLTSIMSNTKTMQSMLGDHFDSVADGYGAMGDLTEDSSPQKFRVGAQDAFAELLALFKNNGLTRFPELSHASGQSEDVWSPVLGTTGAQMVGRAGDVYKRGNVLFRLRGKAYLGYFKTFNFSMDAEKPFSWDFDFTFRVRQTYTSLFMKA